MWGKRFWGRRYWGLRYWPEEDNPTPSDRLAMVTTYTAGAINEDLNRPGVVVP